MIIFNDLEERLLQLYKRRSDMLVIRRQEDVKDQCMEYSTGKFLIMRTEQNIVLLIDRQSNGICQWNITNQ